MRKNSANVIGILQIGVHKYVQIIAKWLIELSVVKISALRKFNNQYDRFVKKLVALRAERIIEDFRFVESNPTVPLMISDDCLKLYTEDEFHWR